MPFWSEKWNSCKVKKTRHFPKGLVNGFCQKIDLFLICFFKAKKARKKLFLIFWIETNAFFDVKSEVLKKSKKSTFWKGVRPWFLSKNWPFSWSCFLSKEGQKETFFDILDTKECFLDHKKKVLKNSKKSTFCKGVSPWFLSKNRPVFHVFFEQKKPERNIFWYSR